MRIDYLSLTNFRNYARLEMPLPQQPLVLHGDNAQGKTSLLEALYYLATSRSPYTTSDRQLIHWRALEEPIAFTRLTAEINNRQRSLNSLEMTLFLDGGESSRFKKDIKLNGSQKRVMDIIGLLNVVLFLPQDLSLVEGSPSDRRRFMDNTLSQLDAAYYAALNQYEKILPQRNALLRQIAERRADKKQLAYWDEQLIQAGSVIISGRQGLLRELETLASQIHRQLTGGRETLTLNYQPSFMPTAKDNGQRSFDLIGFDLHRELKPEQIAPQFREQLEADFNESVGRGVTIAGPHRDELRLMINNRDCGLYGSRGQARTAVLALKIAELEWMKGRIGEYPLLLLDEVVAELDSKRRAFLLNRLDGQAQTLLTTTELDIFSPDFLERAAIWRVIDGQIQPG